jgi:hypothetical protein
LPHKKNHGVGDGVWNFGFNIEASEILNREEVSLIIDYICTV